ncbi:hypothetical protein F3K02_12410 [Hydrogenophaga sp. D2P1]|uniref:Uncharacterized protein n=1 Tax=Hydrogenophaga aromaticivorans TaxID=2610898 RepID=A0A7Y8KXY1_9BURK|nr:helicase associated domain-containing protein [Hydrogenophaga aromaticivorans]NWF46047.1 hypothetical protein [Hydrogenophaga aromaticivorans]
MQHTYPRLNRLTNETKAWLASLERYTHLKSVGWNGITPRGHELEKWVQKQRTLHHQAKLLPWKKAALDKAGFAFVAPRKSKTPTDQDHARNLVVFFQLHGHYAPTQTDGGAALTKWWGRFRDTNGQSGLTTGSKESALEALQILKSGIPEFVFDGASKSQINESKGLTFNGFNPKQPTHEIDADLLIHSNMKKLPQLLLERVSSIEKSAGALSVITKMLRRAALFGQVLRVEIREGGDTDHSWLVDIELFKRDGVDRIRTTVSSNPVNVNDIYSSLILSDTTLIGYYDNRSRYGCISTDHLGRQVIISYDAILGDQMSSLTKRKSKLMPSTVYMVKPRPLAIQSLIDGHRRRMSATTTAHIQFLRNMNDLISRIKAHGKNAGLVHLKWNDKGYAYKFMEHMIRKSRDMSLSFSHAEQLHSINVTWGKERIQCADLFGPILHPQDQLPV